MLKVLSITVVRSDHGPDTCLVAVDLPNGCHPYNGTATLRLDLAAGSAEEYLATNLPGVPVKMIDHSHVEQELEET